MYKSVSSVAKRISKILEEHKLLQQEKKKDVTFEVNVAIINKWHQKQYIFGLQGEEHEFKYNLYPLPQSIWQRST
jgi:hypothetical protein